MYGIELANAADDPPGYPTIGDNGKLTRSAKHRRETESKASQRERRN
jgi:hypothetical protein